MWWSLPKLIAVAGAVCVARGAKVNVADARNAKNIAIIGAGAAGSSAAYHLRKFADEQGLCVNISVFEKTDHVGGRTVTVNVFDDANQPVELGASIFIKANHIIYNATQNFQLNLTELSAPDPAGYTAIWDGEAIVFRSEASSSWWWDAAKLFWKYGLAPYQAVKLVKSAVGTFLQLYEEPNFPFRSLTQRAFELGLLRLTGVTGEQYLQENNINPRFVREVMQPASRVNYASNLAFIHGLEAIVSFATEGAVSVSGGNYQVFEKLLQHSRAAHYPNTTVTGIAFHKGTNKPGSIPKYALSTKSSSPRSRVAKLQTVFDSVVIASPWQFSGIEAADGVIKHHIDSVPYMALHVTLFTSPLRLQASYFGLEPGSKAPSNVYTTLGSEETAQEGPKGVGRTGFYSISTLRTITNPTTGKKEFLYKIFSAEPVNSTFLSTILGADIPDSFVSNDSAAGVEPVSWYHAHCFHSYPIGLPRVTFQDPILGRGLYYTSGVESFISTMETSALMGMNVARLIVDDFAGISRNRWNQIGQFSRNPAKARQDFWDSMDSEMRASMDFLGADEL